MTSRRWHWEWGGRGGVAAGLISAILFSYLNRDIGALLGIPGAAVLAYRVVWGWPVQSHKDRLARWSVLLGIICVAVILVVAFPVRRLADTAWQAKETRRAKEIVGKLIDTGNEINGRWVQGFQTQDVTLRKKAEDDINTWRGIAGDRLSQCPFQENVWLHDVATQAGNLIVWEVARLHTIRDHIDDFLAPSCFTIWRWLVRRHEPPVSGIPSFATGQMMDEQAILYALSTLAQTCAALAAFVGAVGLFRLQYLFSGRRDAERDVRGAAVPAGLFGAEAYYLPLPEIEASIDKNRATVERGNPYYQRLQAAGHTLDNLRAFPGRIRTTRKALMIFEAWNVLIIGVSLVGFNNVHGLACWWVSALALWVAAIGTVGVTGYGVYAWTRG